MDSEQMKERLIAAGSLEEVKSILKDRPEVDAKKVWQEIQNHRSSKAEKLDLNELDAVSGGADRDWVKDGCAATCEENSWCGSNDWCNYWDVTYDNFWSKCPDGHEHVYEEGVCVRCGHNKPSGPSGTFPR